MKYKIKHKARLVAKGYTQEYGVNYEEIFSPDARMDIMRIILGLVTHKDWHVF